MTFANGLARGVALTALALGSMGVVSAQNGTNYHVLNNNGDAVFLGIGAGGTQTASDGIGTFVAGEDCRGSLQVNFGGTLGIQFSYRNTAFRENACVFNPGISGFVQLRFPGIYFISDTVVQIVTMAPLIIIVLVGVKGNSDSGILGTSYAVSELRFDERISVQLGERQTHGTDGFSEGVSTGGGEYVHDIGLANEKRQSKEVV